VAGARSPGGHKPSAIGEGNGSFDPLVDLFFVRELISKSVGWSELAAGESIREVVAEVGEGGDMNAPILGVDPERTNEHLVGLC